MSTPSAVFERVDSLTHEELDALPFGAIQLDREGRILRFNEYEANLSNRRAPDTVGRNFFRDVAPCTNVREFHGRFLEGPSADISTRRSITDSPSRLRRATCA